jgi:hypothetical protein
MTEHTTDVFDTEGGITETQRAAGLNAALHLYNGLGKNEKAESGVAGLLTNADAISRFLNNGTTPA